MKKVILVVLLAVLCGCAVRRETLLERVQATIAAIDDQNESAPANQRREYFSYYLPRHIGKRFSSMDMVTFVHGSVVFYMNIDIPGIIVETYYKDEQTSAAVLQTTPGNRIVFEQGQIKNDWLTNRSYLLAIDEIEDQYLLLLKYGRTQFTSLVALAEIEDTLYNMFQIAKSVQINTDALLRDYSNKSIVVIHDKYNLFESTFPESGVIKDLLFPNKDTTVHEEEDETTPQQELSHEEDEDQLKAE